MSVQIWVMGEPTLTDPSGAPVRLVSRRAWGLLTYLIRAQGGPVARTDLADLLWPQSGEEQARASLRQELAVTRKSLRAAGLDPIEAGKDFVRFTGAPMLSDCSAIEDLIATGGTENLRAAAGLCRGPLLDGINVRSEPFMDWLTDDRATFNTLLTRAFSELLSSEIASGDPNDIIAAAEAWLDIAPTAEVAHRAVMRVFAEAGQPAEALRQFDRCLTELRRSGTGAPSPETAALAREIRAMQEAAPPRSAADPAPARTAAAPAPRATGEPAPEPAVERGVATVLVAQLPQLATLPLGFDPAAVSDAQDRFMEFAARIAEDAGGWLLPGPGDRAVAVFPAEAELAAGLAALMLTTEPVPLDRARPISPACGLAQGAVMLSEGGGLAGVALQAAARAAALAQAGEVLSIKALAAGLAEEFNITDGPAPDLVRLAADRPGPAPDTPPIVTPELVHLWQAWGQALMRADLRSAMSQGREASRLAGEGRAVGDTMTGAVLLLRGQVKSAQEPLTRAEDLYSSSEPFGLDPGLTARALLAWQKCVSGAPGQGGEALRRALSEAQGLRHPPTTLMCLLIAAIVQDELGETRAAFRSANAAYQAADGRPQIQALALACVGRCRDRIGEPAGAEHLEDALRRYRGAGGVAATGLIHGWRASSRLETGAMGEGLAVIEEGLAEASASGLLLPEPELLRLQATLLARQGKAGLDQIETAFVAAIETAQKAGAGLLQLRASVSFAAHLRSLGRLRDAATRLDRGIAAITPGGPMAADLKSAHALRQRLDLG